MRRIQVKKLNQLITILMLAGIATIIAGLIYRLFPKQKGSRCLKITDRINNLASSKLLNPILTTFSGNETSTEFG